MKLIPVPGAPGYYIDCEGQKAYSCKNGVIHALTDRTAYRTLVVQIDGRPVGTTIWRLMYCATNNIPLTTIPNGFCITFDHKENRLVVKEKKDTIEKAIQANGHSNKAARKLDNVLANIRLVKRYYKGDTEPLLNHLKEVEKKEQKRWQWMFGVSKTRAEIITSQAVNVYLDELANGFPDYCIKRRIRALSRKENRKMSRTNIYQVWMDKIIEIP